MVHRMMGEVPSLQTWTARHGEGWGLGGLFGVMIKDVLLSSFKYSALVNLPFVGLDNLSLLDSAREIQTAKQMNGNQKRPSYCETYEMNFHRSWKGDDGIYFGYRF